MNSNDLGRWQQAVILPGVPTRLDVVDITVMALKQEVSVTTRKFELFHCGFPQNLNYLPSLTAGVPDLVSCLLAGLQVEHLHIAHVGAGQQELAVPAEGARCEHVRAVQYST